MHLLPLFYDSWWNHLQKEAQCVAKSFVWHSSANGSFSTEDCDLRRRRKRRVLPRNIGFYNDIPIFYRMIILNDANNDFICMQKLCRDSSIESFIASKSKIKSSIGLTRNAFGILFSANMPFLFYEDVPHDSRSNADFEVCLLINLLAFFRVQAVLSGYNVQISLLWKAYYAKKVMLWSMYPVNESESLKQ